MTMRCAVIAVTDVGAQLGKRIADGLVDVDVSCYVRRMSQPPATVTFFQSTPQLTASIFNQFDVLIYIMAIGIVVRSIAPHIQDKTRDPAVLVIDELGNHVISLLSGHLGGANEWATRVAEIIHARPVITTATDVHQRPAPDVLARKIRAKVEPVAMLKPVNAAIARGEEVSYYLDERMPLATDIARIAQEMGIVCQSFSERTHQTSATACVLMTDRVEPFDDIQVPYVILRPPTLVAGMGCRRGTAENLLDTALIAACQQIGRSPLSVGGITTVTIKQDEEGLLSLADTRRVPIAFYTSEEMEKAVADFGLEESRFVKNTIGVGNVCETTAILKTNNPQLLLQKTKFPKTTVALAEATSLLWD